LIQNLQGHNSRRPANAAKVRHIISCRRYNSGAMGSVAMIIFGIAGFIGEIISVNVIHISIVIIIDSGEVAFDVNLAELRQSREPRVVEFLEPFRETIANVRKIDFI
jgi:hypothetical protein